MSGRFEQFSAVEDFGVSRSMAKSAMDVLAIQRRVAKMSERLERNRARRAKKEASVPDIFPSLGTGIGLPEAMVSVLIEPALLTSTEAENVVVFDEAEATNYRSPDLNAPLKDPSVGQSERISVFLRLEREGSLNNKWRKFGRYLRMELAREAQA